VNGADPPAWSADPANGADWAWWDGERWTAYWRFTETRGAAAAELAREASVIDARAVNLRQSKPAVLFRTPDLDAVTDRLGQQC
jgi:hypothetical protein